MVSTRSTPATAARNCSPVSRSAPWCTCTASFGANRAASRCQLPTSDIGQTSSVGPRSGGLLAFAFQQRQDLDGLAQAHVVGQHRARAERVHERQPAQPALLVGAQRAPNPSGVGSDWKPPPGPPASSSPSQPVAATPTIGSPVSAPSPSRPARSTSRAVIGRRRTCRAA